MMTRLEVKILTVKNVAYATAQVLEAIRAMNNSGLPGSAVFATATDTRPGEKTSRVKLTLGSGMVFMLATKDGRTVLAPHDHHSVLTLVLTGCESKCVDPAWCAHPAESEIANLLAEIGRKFSDALTIRASTQ